jgi:hypothetical protein
MLSQKLFVEVSVDMFADENRSLVAGSRNIYCSFQLACLFLPLRCSARSTPSFNTFFTVQNLVFALAEVLGNLCLVLSCAEL